MNPVRLLSALLVFGALDLYAPPAATQETVDVETELRLARDSLDAGAPTRAIERLELLADRGILHPDASFDRAAAYLHRAESPHAVPGDRGRAVAALAETLALRPDDEEAARLLEAVQERIASRRDGGETLGLSRPPLGFVLVGLLPEHGWALLSLCGAWLLTLGLGLRLWGRQAAVRLTGTIGASVAGALLILGAAMLLGRRHLLATTSQAVVVSETARLLDAQGRPLPGKPALTTLPEGAEVVVTRRGERLHQVSSGDRQGWIAAEQLRLLPQSL